MRTRPETSRVHRLVQSWCALPIEGATKLSPLASGVKPALKGGHERRTECALVSASGAEVVSVQTSKLGGDLGTGVTPIRELCAQQHSVGLSVVVYVCFIRRTVWVAMVRLFLSPTAVRLMVDIVAKRVAPAGVKARTFPPKPLIVPIVVKGHGFANAHDKYQRPSAPIRGAASAYDPITYLRSLPYARLTGSQRTHGEKRVGRKAVVSRHNVGIQLHL